MLPRHAALWVTAAVAFAAGVLALERDPVWWYLAVPGALLTLTGIHDLLQTRHSILRNYPIVGHLRFILEAIRPEIRQYFFEDDRDKTPFSRVQRSLVYQRAK